MLIENLVCKIMVSAKIKAYIDISLWTKEDSKALLEEDGGNSEDFLEVVMSELSFEEWVETEIKCLVPVIYWVDIVFQEDSIVFLQQGKFSIILELAIIKK